MKIKLISLFVFFLYWNFTKAQNVKTYSFEELKELQVQQTRNVVIFIHTQWCSYCKAMKVKTFEKKEVYEKLNNQYYFVEFDAESTKDIIFYERVFKFKPTGRNTGINELAEVLGSIKGKISYPTIVILNSENEIIFQHDSFLNAKDMEMILIEALAL